MENNYNQLIDQAKSGDENAFNTLYSSIKPMATFYARSIAKDEYLADEAVQISAIKMYQSLNSLKDVDSFEGWFKRIVRNQTLDLLRKNGKEINFTSFDTEVDQDFEYNIADEKIEYQPELQFNKSEKEAIIHEIISALPDNQRTPIMMFFFEEMKIKEIAEELGVNENTIKTRLTAGKKNIGVEVEKIQKRDGYKLYNITPIGFLLWLLRGYRQDYGFNVSSDMYVPKTTEPSQKTINSLEKQIGSAQKVVSSDSVSKTVSTAIPKVATKAGLSIGAKIAVASLLTVGALGGSYLVYNSIKNKDVAEEEIIEETKEIVVDENGNIIGFSSQLEAIQYFNANLKTGDLIFESKEEAIEYAKARGMDLADEAVNVGKDDQNNISIWNYNRPWTYLQSDETFSTNKSSARIFSSEAEARLWLFNNGYGRYDIFNGGSPGEQNAYYFWDRANNEPVEEGFDYSVEYIDLDNDGNNEWAIVYNGPETSSAEIVVKKGDLSTIFTYLTSFEDVFKKSKTLGLAEYHIVVGSGEYGNYVATRAVNKTWDCLSIDIANEEYNSRSIMDFTQDNVNDNISYMLDFYVPSLYHTGYTFVTYRGTDKVTTIFIGSNDNFRGMPHGDVEIYLDEDGKLLYKLTPDNYDYDRYASEWDHVIAFQNEILSYFGMDITDIVDLDIITSAVEKQ